ncbi:MAG: flagellar protein FliT [Thiohalobacteraceae bacterium]
MSSHAAMRRNEVDRLQTLTGALLAAAKSGEWDKAAALEEERRPLLYRVFGEAAPGTQTQQLELLRTILSVDRDITELAQQRREELGGMLRQVGQGRAALRAYESNR